MESEIEVRAAFVILKLGEAHESRSSSKRVFEAGNRLDCGKATSAKMSGGNRVAKGQDEVTSASIGPR